MTNEDWLRGLQLLTGGTVEWVGKRMGCTARNVLRLQHEGNVTLKRAAQMVALVRALRRDCDEWLARHGG